MITRKQITILSILGIAIISITVFIEVLVKPHLSNINSGKVSPFVIYIHSKLEIMMDGKPIRIPSQIGIEDHLWNDHSLDKFGAPGMPMDEKGEKTMPGMAPVYTTNDKGRITIGSIVDRNYTLDEFLRIWGDLDLKEKRVNATVNGKPVNNYENIILEDNQKVKLDITNTR